MTTLWSDRADLAQHSLTALFGGLTRGSLRNTHPLTLRQTLPFNYWWLAHGVAARVDGAERRRVDASGPRAPEHPLTPSRAPGADAAADALLILAERGYAGIRRRNLGRLFNDYFDDMGWLTLAALRLFDATANPRYLVDAESLWLHIVDNGWNPAFGASLAWRKPQLEYKNAPTNGAFAVASYRLFARTGRPRYARYADDALAWLERTLVEPQTGIVADGINRTGDGAVDSGWRFSYNQGVYVGALVEASTLHGDAALLDRALQTASATLETLDVGGETSDPHTRGGGDIGLFKGIFWHYLADLVLAGDVAATADARFRMLGTALRDTTDALWQSSYTTLETHAPAHAAGRQRTTVPLLLAGDTWTTPPPPGPTYLATQLSAVLAVEARARLERGAQ